MDELEEIPDIARVCVPPVRRRLIIGLMTYIS